MKTRNAPRDPIGPAAGLGHLLSLYRDCSLGFRLFVAHRWWHARLSEVESLVPESGLILDLGCGHGVVANLMGMRSSTRRVIGFERDGRKAAIGRGRLSNVEIRTCDVLRADLPPADVVSIIDVLHHLESPRAQQLLLEKAVACLGNTGVLVVKEVTRSRPLRFRATLVLDRLAYPRDRFYFLRHEELHQGLEGRGLSVEMIPLWRRTPYAHYAMVCRRPGKAMTSVRHRRMEQPGSAQDGFSG